MFPTKVLLVLPTYNESENILRQLTELDGIRKKISDKYVISIINVDDNSPDGTAKIARDMDLESFFQISNSGKIGLGPAYMLGFKWGLERDFDYFVEMDSDGSHLTVQLPDLLKASANHDLTIGTRWMPGGLIENWPWYRRLISKLGTAYAAAFLNLPIRDLTSGYRIMSRQFLESIDFKTISTKGYGFQIEMALQAHVNGFSVAQIPITFIERRAGRSKMTAGIALEAFKFITVRGFMRIFGLHNRR
jgi:dolichol-phosphate mannosyltransferase